jgi:hypothetical protein
MFTSGMVLPLINFDLHHWWKNAVFMIDFAQHFTPHTLVRAVLTAESIVH